MDTTPDWYKGSYNPNGHCSLYEKAVEYCCAVIQGRDDEDRVYLHKELAALYGLEPSETRHITDNLPIPMDPYAETFSETLAKCASLITNEFQKLKDIKEVDDMTYDERKMCNTYTSLVGIANGIQHIYMVGGYELLSDEAKRKLSNAEAEIQEVMNETYKYVSEHTKEEN